MVCIMDFRCIIVLWLQIHICTQLFQLAESQGISISAPECYDTTTCPCCDGPCRSDGWCNGNCKDGYYGGKCWNYCPRNCVRCVDAQQGDDVANCTLCQDGYYSTPTQYQCQLSCSAQCKTCDSSTQCTSCRDGDYLTSSNQCISCNDGCLTCTSGIGCTSCKTGFYLDGGNCTRCSPLCGRCTSSDKCVCSNGCSGGNCFASTGNCVFGCHDNFVHGDSSKCDICTSGMYGYMCNKTCGDNCESSCDRITGICTTCKPGFYGERCGETCSVNCAYVCDKTTGNCDECKDGYYGNNCTLGCNHNCKECTISDGLCTTCIDGLYGDVCDKNCSHNCILSKCDKDRGTCECKAGYIGDRCEIEATTPVGTTIINPWTVIPGSARSTGVGIIVGVAVGGAVIAIIVIVIGTLCYRRRVREVEQGSDREKRRRKQIEQIEREISKLDVKMLDMRQDAQTAVNRKDELQRKLEDKKRGNIGRTVGRTKEDYYESLQRSHDDVSPYSSLNK